MNALSSAARPRLPKVLLAALPLLALGAGQPTGVLHVAVDNVRDHTGHVHVDLCTQPQFLKACPIVGNAPAQTGLTMVTLRGLKPGRYAVQVFYDENGNNKVDRAMFGIPKEGVGFSNDAKIKMGPPKWDDAAFDYDGQERTIRLRLRYFIGPNAPIPVDASR